MIIIIYLLYYKKYIMYMQICVCVSIVYIYIYMTEVALFPIMHYFNMY